MTQPSYPPAWMTARKANYDAYFAELARRGWPPKRFIVRDYLNLQAAIAGERAYPGPQGV